MGISLKHNIKKDNPFKGRINFGYFKKLKLFPTINNTMLASKTLIVSGVIIKVISQNLVSYTDHG